MEVEIDFNNLPYEVFEHILNFLTYVDMIKLKTVSKEWNDTLSYLISRFTWERFGDPNELNLILERNRNHPDANYNWFLRPTTYVYEHTEDDPYTSLPQLYGISQIEYTFGAPNVLQYCEYYDINDQPEILLEKRKRWCDQVIINEVGNTQYKLMKQLTKEFIKERFDIYNSHYPVKLTFGENIIPLLLARRTMNEFRVQFTSEGFMAHEQIRREHDFKLFKFKQIKNADSFEDNIEIHNTQNNTPTINTTNNIINNTTHNTLNNTTNNAWKWEGLGDNWENMNVKQILEAFNPTLKEDGQISFNILSLNPNSNTISHLFEAILYVSECILDKHPIKWD